MIQMITAPSPNMVRPRISPVVCISTNGADRLKARGPEPISTKVPMVASAPAGFAQGKKGEPATRSVQGAVTNPDDSPAAGAVVQLKSTKTLQVRSFITKEDGTYHFFELSPDVDYELKADFQGASSG